MATIKGGENYSKVLKNLAYKLGKPSTLRVGFLEGATYPDGKSVAMIAAIQNFGAPSRGIPPRPFFTNMVKDKSPQWGGDLGKVLKAADLDGQLALERMGEHIKGQLQDSIIDTNDPPLSPVTVMLRGMRANNPSLKVTGKTVAEARARVAAGETNYDASTKPLIDTAVMENAVGAEVKS